MKTVGIIAEYNPLHNGHLYQIRQARTLSDADYVIIVMSGDFVQRGEPAVYDKYTRTRMALNAGADLVLELPSCFATGSAEDFASCGIALLDCLGVVNALCFGSECGNVQPLYDAAAILDKEPEPYRKLLKQNLADGLSFPKARADALMSVISQSHSACDCRYDSNDNLESLLASPNNILGIEYIKALMRQNSRIKPLTIQRSGSGYHDTELSDDTVFASASAIRKALQDGNVNAVRDQIPAFPVNGIPVFANDISSLFNYRLLELTQNKANLTDFSDVSKELQDRLSRQILDFDTFTGRIQALKTKQYTYTRISRALLHILLGIRDCDIQDFRDNGYVSYARVLGFKQSTVPLLSVIKANGRIPLITKTANAARILESDPLGWRSFQYDLHASHLYQAVQYQKSGVRGKNEFTSPVIIADSNGLF